MGYKFGVTTSHYKIININKKYHGVLKFSLGINIRVKITSRKFSVKKKTIHFSIPSLRGFLKAIERFFKVEKRDVIILNIANKLFPRKFVLVNPHAKRHI
jgi:hypothetical protein